MGASQYLNLFPYLPLYLYLLAFWPCPCPWPCLAAPTPTLLVLEHPSGTLAVKTRGTSTHEWVSKPNSIDPYHSSIVPTSELLSAYDRGNEELIALGIIPATREDTFHIGVNPISGNENVPLRARRIGTLSGSGGAVPVHNGEAVLALDDTLETPPNTIGSSQQLWSKLMPQTMLLRRPALGLFRRGLFRKAADTKSKFEANHWGGDLRQETTFRSAVLTDATNSAAHDFSSWPWRLAARSWRVPYPNPEGALFLFTINQDELLTEEMDETPAAEPDADTKLETKSNRRGLNRYFIPTAVIQRKLAITARGIEREVATIQKAFKHPSVDVGIVPILGGTKTTEYRVLTGRIRQHILKSIPIARVEVQSLNLPTAMEEVVSPFVENYEEPLLVEKKVVVLAEPIAKELPSTMTAEEFPLIVVVRHPIIYSIAKPLNIIVPIIVNNTETKEMSATVGNMNESMNTSSQTLVKIQEQGSPEGCSLHNRLTPAFDTKNLTHFTNSREMPSFSIASSTEKAAINLIHPQATDETLRINLTTQSTPHSPIEILTLPESTTPLSYSILTTDLQKEKVVDKTLLTTLIPPELHSSSNLPVVSTVHIPTTPAPSATSEITQISETPPTKAPFSHRVSKTLSTLNLTALHGKAMEALIPGVPKPANNAATAGEWHNVEEKPLSPMRFDVKMSSNWEGVVPMVPKADSENANPEMDFYGRASNKVKSISLQTVMMNHDSTSPNPVQDRILVTPEPVFHPPEQVMSTTRSSGVSVEAQKVQFTGPEGSITPVVTSNSVVEKETHEQEAVLTSPQGLVVKKEAKITPTVYHEATTGEYLPSNIEVTVPKSPENDINMMSLLEFKYISSGDITSSSTANTSANTFTTVSSSSILPAVISSDIKTTTQRAKSLTEDAKVIISDTPYNKQPDSFQQSRDKPMHVLQEHSISSDAEKQSNEIHRSQERSKAKVSIEAVVPTKQIEVKLDGEKTVAKVIAVETSQRLVEVQDIDQWKGVEQPPQKTIQTIVEPDGTVRKIERYVVYERVPVTHSFVAQVPDISNKEIIVMKARNVIGSETSNTVKGDPTVSFPDLILQKPRLSSNNQPSMFSLTLPSPAQSGSSIITLPAVMKNSILSGHGDENKDKATLTSKETLRDSIIPLEESSMLSFLMKNKLQHSQVNDRTHTATVVLQPSSSVNISERNGIFSFTSHDDHDRDGVISLNPAIMSHLTSAELREGGGGSIKFSNQNVVDVLKNSGLNDSAAKFNSTVKPSLMQEALGLKGSLILSSHEIMQNAPEFLKDETTHIIKNPRNLNIINLLLQNAALGKDADAVNRSIFLLNDTSKDLDKGF